MVQGGIFKLNWWVKEKWLQSQGLCTGHYSNICCSTEQFSKLKRIEVFPVSILGLPFLLLLLNWVQHGFGLQRADDDGYVNMYMSTSFNVHVQHLYKTFNFSLHLSVITCLPTSVKLEYMTSYRCWISDCLQTLMFSLSWCWWWERTSKVCVKMCFYRL